MAVLVETKETHLSLKQMTPSPGQGRRMDLFTGDAGKTNPQCSH